MNTLIGYDLVPEPKILEAALRACRRLNDLASAIRILEAVKVSKTLWTIAEYATVTLIVLKLHYVTWFFLKHFKFEFDLILFYSSFIYLFIYLFTQDKSGPHKEIYPYVLQELQPTLNELGIPTPEELGINKA